MPAASHRGGEGLRFLGDMDVGRWHLDGLLCHLLAALPTGLGCSEIGNAWESGHLRAGRGLRKGLVEDSTRCPSSSSARIICYFLGSVEYMSYNIDKMMKHIIIYICTIQHPSLALRSEDLRGLQAEAGPEVQQRHPQPGVQGLCSISFYGWVRRCCGISRGRKRRSTS